MTIRRRSWPTEVKMPRLVDEHLSIAAIRQALEVAQHDGPSLTLEEGLEWLELNVHGPPNQHPPSPSKPPGTRGKRMRRRYATPAGRPGRLQRSEASAAA